MLALQCPSIKLSPSAPPPSCSSAPSASTVPNGRLPLHCKLTVLKQLYNYSRICCTGVYSVGVERRGRNSTAQREKVSRHDQQKTAAFVKKLEINNLYRPKRTKRQKPTNRSSPAGNLRRTNRTGRMQLHDEPPQYQRLQLGNTM